MCDTFIPWHQKCSLKNHVTQKYTVCVCGGEGGSWKEGGKLEGGEYLWFYISCGCANIAAINRFLYFLGLQVTWHVWISTQQVFTETSSGWRFSTRNGTTLSFRCQTLFKHRYVSITSICGCYIGKQFLFACCRRSAVPSEFIQT